MIDDLSDNIEFAQFVKKRAKRYFLGDLEPWITPVHIEKYARRRGVKGHRPVLVKRTVIGSKGGWKLSTIFLSCKVFHNWSIIKQQKYMHLLDRYIFAVIFDDWPSFVLHIGIEACELHFYTMRLYCKHTFIYKKLTGSQIRAFVFLLLC